MKVSNKEKLVSRQVSRQEVEQWLIDSIPSITPYQREWIRQSGVVENAPFRFCKYYVKPTLFWRLFRSVIINLRNLEE